MNNRSFKHSSKKYTVYGRGRLLAWLLMGLLFAVMMVPVTGYRFGSTVVAQTQSGTESNVRAEFWREVRQGTQGYTAVQGPETNVLIQNGGENWRSLREGAISIYSAWLMAFVLFMAGLLHIINGRQKIEAGRSGMTIERWTLFERAMHWYVAVLFIVMALTGLSLLYGREVLIPLLGKSAFAAYAGFAKVLHNYLGPFFSAGMLLMIIVWFKDNLPIREDLQWAKSAGGMWGSGHPPAAKANAGEKLMYWQFVATGLALIATGFILDFPNFGQTREMMQWSHGIHVIVAIVAIVTTMGHIYMALFGVEGALEGMVNGRVDTHWAEQHHDLWYQKLLAKGVKPEPAEERGASEVARAEPRSTS